MSEGILRRPWDKRCACVRRTGQTPDLSPSGTLGKPKKGWSRVGGRTTGIIDLRMEADAVTDNHSSFNERQNLEAQVLQPSA
jgi:hypothetical protein